MAIACLFVYVFLSRETYEEPILRCFGLVKTKKYAKITFHSWPYCCSDVWREPVPSCEAADLTGFPRNKERQQRNVTKDQIIRLCTTKIYEKGLPVCIELVILIKKVFENPPVHQLQLAPLVQCTAKVPLGGAKLPILGWNRFLHLNQRGGTFKVTFKTSWL